jgi:hypothetical protein
VIEAVVVVKPWRRDVADFDVLELLELKEEVGGCGDNVEDCNVGVPSERDCVAKEEEKVRGCDVENLVEFNPGKLAVRVGKEVGIMVGTRVTGV